MITYHVVCPLCGKVDVLFIDLDGEPDSDFADNGGLCDDCSTRI